MLSALMPHKDYPDELLIAGRIKLHTSIFRDNDKLYHGFDNSDLDDMGQIKLETIRFPDFSCNWDRFSKPFHVRYRRNGTITDGCYSFPVKTARYKKCANVVHDPIDDPEFPNYSHVEIRRLLEGEDIDFEPPKERKWKQKSTKALRLEYRQNILNNHEIELNIGD